MARGTQWQHQPGNKRGVAKLRCLDLSSEVRGLGRMRCGPWWWTTSWYPIRERRHSGRLAHAPVLGVYDGFMEPRSPCSSRACARGQGLSVLLPPWAIFQEGAGAGVCSGSRWENSHSGSLPSHVSPEICEVPSLGQTWCQFAAHLLLLLLSQNNSRKCHKLWHRKDFFFFNIIGFCFLLFIDSQGSVIYLYAFWQAMNTQKGISLYIQSCTEHSSRKWCLGWHSKGVVTSYGYRQGHGLKGTPKPHQEISKIFCIWSFTWCGRLSKSPCPLSPKICSCLDLWNLWIYYLT